jgi:hypothetical protein
MIQYFRAASTTFPDGTIVSDADLGGAMSIVDFNVSASATQINVTAAIPPMGEAPLLPFLNYRVLVAAMNTRFIGPFSDFSTGQTLTAGS